MGVEQRVAVVGALAGPGGSGNHGQRRQRHDRGRQDLRGDQRAQHVCEARNGAQPGDAGEQDRADAAGDQRETPVGAGFGSGQVGCRGGGAAFGPRVGQDDKRGRGENGRAENVQAEAVGEPADQGGRQAECQADRDEGAAAVRPGGPADLAAPAERPAGQDDGGVAAVAEPAGPRERAVAVPAGQAEPGVRIVAAIVAPIIGHRRSASSCAPGEAVPDSAFPTPRSRSGRTPRLEI